MGKSPKADSKNQPLDPPPQDPFEAKEAIQKGRVAPIGSYLRYDLPQILNLLADQLDVPNGDESRVERSKIESAPKDHPTKTDSIGHDWDSNTSDVLRCIEDGKPAPVGWFLRDLADFLSKLGRVFDPEATSEEWNLTFSRRTRGPPKDIWKAATEGSLVKMQVIKRTRKYGKQEAAIQELVDEGKMSRATVFRNLARKKSLTKKPK